MQTGEFPARIAAASAAFADSNATLPEDFNDALAFLTAEPTRDPPVDYVTDVERRLEIARQVQAWSENNIIEFFNPLVGWSVLMTAPIDQLQDEEGNEPGKNAARLVDLVTYCLCVLLRIFLAKPLSEELRVSAGIEAETKKEVCRDMKEAEKCLLRDGHQCIVTGARYPQTCHIFPFSSLRDPVTTRTALSQVLYHGFGPARNQEVQRLLIGDDNIVDKAANMLALDPRLHHLWGKGLIAFEPIGRIQNGVRLRFRWMKRSSRSIRTRVPIGLDPREELIWPEGEGSMFVRHAATGRRILDGEIVEVRSDDPALLPNMTILKLQWDLLKMAALSGAGEASEDPSWYPNFEDPTSCMALDKDKEELDIQNKQPSQKPTRASIEPEPPAGATDTGPGRQPASP